MRWCHHCHHFNTAWPARCHYCGAGLAGRLCTRNHVNPLDWRLTFCGDCGAPLQRISGAGFSILPYLVAGAIWLATWLVIGVLLVLGHWAPGTAFILILVVATVGSYLAWQLLPPGGQRVLSVASKVIARVTMFMLRLLLRTVSRWRSKTRHKRRG